MKIKQQTVVCGMSGGIDSSTAALLLKLQGYRVIGVFLHFWYEATAAQRRAISEEKCCSIEGQTDARKVARHLEIPFYTLNFSQSFKTSVVQPFISDFQRGKTPNPCITCNREMKFGLFLSKAQEIFHADYIATGHYAQIQKIIQKSEGFDGQSPHTIFSIQKGADKRKDQSYFLYHLTQDKLKHILFPVGHLKKQEVIALAKKYHLPLSDKDESQGICFLKEGNHYSFLQRNLKHSLKKGPIITEKGKVIGHHKGLPLYTRGQRRGVQIGGRGPYYVTRMNHRTNALYISNDRYHPKLYSKRIILRNVQVMVGDLSRTPLSVSVKIRHGQQEVPANVFLKNKKTILEFIEPQRAVMKGQSAVFYQKNQLIGGGVIC